MNFKFRLNHLRSEKYKNITRPFIFACAISGIFVISNVMAEADSTAFPYIKNTPSEAETATKSDSDPIIKDASGYTGFFIDDTGSKYYINGNAMKDRFFLANGEMYHASETGYIDTESWVFAKNGRWYYFDENGISVDAGWIYNDDSWQYLDENGIRIAGGWYVMKDEDENELWYYFDENGEMLTDTETPDGYYVGPDGLWIKPSAKAYSGDGFTWNKSTENGKSQISGLMIADMPAEFYMLSIAGETSGMSNPKALVNGDGGRAYGACQFDYRYDLIGFMKYAYKKHPNLWPGFSKYLSYSSGNTVLKGNSDIANTFLNAMSTDYETAISDQLEYIRMQYWDGFANRMNAAGFDLNNRHIAVSAALLSVNVNCGAQSSVFINNLSPNMSDEEMIRGIYRIRNTILANQNVGSVKKGTTTRYLRSEPQMALDLLYGYTTIDSDVNYGGGVEWHGNPFVNAITTIELPGEITYVPEVAISETQKEKNIEETTEETTEETSETADSADINESNAEYETSAEETTAAEEPSALIINDTATSSDAPAVIYSPGTSPRN